MSDLDKALASLQFSAQGRAVLDHINRLAAENERLREALEDIDILGEMIACLREGVNFWSGSCGIDARLESVESVFNGIKYKAKAALGKEGI